VTTVTVSDEVLLAQLRAGDTAVLEPLMERFSGRLFRVAQGITRSASDAEEVIQDVFLSLLNKRRGKRAQLEVLIEDHLPTFKEDGHREGDRAFLLAD
jgi:DNA-directed RNA polymerase specialized sigma24 family protein